ncbi:glucosaminidase domain-containing protein [bacterium]|nr:glucosaminidase domain-containing protein [bacterium]MBU1957442.1 glucosaminidase domain-containing protein [bacterium]
MIKHFTALLLLTLTVLAFDNAYLNTVSQGVKNYNVKTEASTTSKHEEPRTQKSPKSNLTTSETISNEKLTVVNKKLRTANDIKIFKTTKIEPINYTNTISLNKLQVSEKKQKFFHMILPAILISKENLRLKRERVLSLMSTPAEELPQEDKEFLENLYETYKTTDNKQLASRLRTHPVSIILAQAAIESAWGESRFFKKGNNIFGMWSYNKNEPRIKANGNRNGKSIYVKKYATLSDAIDDYFVVIGRGAYKNFRKQRKITDDPLQLVQYLVNYCELREQYTNKLKKFIVQNKLRKFDEFEISEQYII